METPTIHLAVIEGIWCIVCYDPLVNSIMETDTLVTLWRSDTPFAKVAAEMRGANPDFKFVQVDPSEASIAHIRKLYS